MSEHKANLREPYAAYPHEMELDVLPNKRPVVHVLQEVTVSASASQAATQHTEAGHDNIIKDFIADFRRAPDHRISGNDASYSGSTNLVTATAGRSYDLRAANVKIANSTLSRDLKGRHLQMIAIGGSIGTLLCIAELQLRELLKVHPGAGLFVASGTALSTGGPASLLIAYIIMGAMQYCTMQALGELVVMFPVAGSFSSYSTRFLDPSWGFAMGWK